MKKVEVGARIIFGLLWVVFGLNFFFHFLPVPPPAEKAGAFLGAMFQTGYFFPFVKITEIAVGLMLLTNRFVPLALIIIAPVTLNIFLVHAMLDPAGVGLSVVLMILNIFLGFRYLDSYKELLKSR
jgi:putative oxidoreductase